MKNFIESLKNGKIFVCDGAMGTSLHGLGLEPGLAPEEWNVTNPEKVKSVHRGFIDAGCGIIITNTFGANCLKLKRTGSGYEIADLNKKAVRIAKDAIEDFRKQSKDKKDIYILGDIGPTGEFLEPVGQCRFEDFYKAFLEQASALCEAGIDGFIIETMSDPKELEIAVTACRKIRQDSGRDLPVIASMTFVETKKGYRTTNGVSIENALTNPVFLLNTDVIGANCGCGSRQMVEVMRQMKGEIRKIGINSPVGREIFLIARPNAGLPELINGKTVFTEPLRVFSQSAEELVRLGVNIIGGCCGTTQEHIREIKKIVGS